MKRKFDESDAPYIPLMMSVVRNCPLIQELEIMGMDYVMSSLLLRAICHRSVP